MDSHKPLSRLFADPLEEKIPAAHTTSSTTMGSLSGISPHSAYPERNTPDAVLQDDGASIPRPTKRLKQPDFLYHSVPICRTPDVMKQRLLLPATMMEQEIVEAVMENDVLLICGETGCGKSTQVPQFLYEAGFCGKKNEWLVAVTQPRRVAAISVSMRVATELNDPSAVGYQ
ncbi:putative ATP-dependent Rna helicase DHX37, partial [Cardiosporidium cionae]